MSKIVETTIDKLRPDDQNFNKGTEYGEHLMEQSLRKFGLGRSILLDMNNRIIAGNKTTEKAGELGFEKVVIVETDGNTLVAVKRNDIDLDSAEGRELALADNATSEANLEWDNGLIAEVAQEFGFIPEEWGVEVKDLFQEEDDDDVNTDEEEQDCIETDIHVGDLFRIEYNGMESRLHCGDSCSVDDVVRFTNGEKANMIFTDPPYDLEDRYSSLIFDSADQDCHIFIMNSDKLLVDNVNNGRKFFKKFFAVDFRVARLVSNSQPMTRVDLIAEFNKGKGRFNNLMDGFSTLIECAKIHSKNNSENFGHKQAKKVELPETFVLHYSNAGELVFDFFAGSGSTMVAALKNDRRIYAQEYDPKNCQRIINRLSERFEGIKITKQ